ncbi:MAG: hypothetical protein IKV33_01165 [Alistipes sp.]|nr:hypothetical protein [Alistipes sp.]
MKRLLIIISFCFALLSAEAKNGYPHMYAHRGCWSKNAAGEFVIPENSVAAVTAAARMGYEGIECDVRLTKDNRMVILHDATLNRTCRRASDYSRLEKPVYLNQLTFEELRRDYVLESADPALRTPIPTLEELLEECKRCGVVPMLHSALMESYHVAQEIFGNEWICFTGGVEHLRRVREFSDCTILLAINDGTAEENIALLKQIGGHCGISTMNYNLYTPQFCKALTDAGYEVQASIFPAPHEAYAQRNGVTFQLTDFSFMPAGKGAKADYTVSHHYGWYNRFGLGSQVEEVTESKSVDYAGYVVEIKMNRKSAEIAKKLEMCGENPTVCVELGGQKYEFMPRGKEKIYIGRRPIDAPLPTVEMVSKHTNHRHLIKRSRVLVYEM